MRYIVTSDIHLGSKYCRAELFNQLIERLHPDVCLTLAGDVVDDPRKRLTDADAEAIRLLAKRSEESRVIWVNGNHDDLHRPTVPGQMEFHETYRIDDRLLVAHGHRFDNVMSHNGWFIQCFKFFHAMRIRLGAPPVHVADYAKKFHPLYAFLRNNVRQNAMENAREVGVPAVACGHVHYAEDTCRDGIRYFNLGAWTEEPTYCLLLGHDSMELLPTPEAMQRSDWFRGEDA